MIQPEERRFYALHENDYYWPRVWPVVAAATDYAREKGWIVRADAEEDVVWSRMYQRGRFTSVFYGRIVHSSELGAYFQLGALIDTQNSSDAQPYAEAATRVVMAHGDTLYVQAALDLPIQAVTALPAQAILAIAKNEDRGGPNVVLRYANSPSGVTRGVYTHTPRGLVGLPVPINDGSRISQISTMTLELALVPLGLPLAVVHTLDDADIENVLGMIVRGETDDFKTGSFADAMRRINDGLRRSDV